MRQRFNSFVLLSILVVPAASEAQIDRGLGRLGPSNVWCQISTSENGDTGMGYTNSDPVILNQGYFELSFVATGSTVDVEIASDATGVLDNFLIVERSVLFDNAASFLSSTCYQGSQPEFPQARVPVFTAGAFPPEIPYAMLFGTTQAALEGLGWTFTNATVDPAGSATENVVLNNEGTVTAVCPGSGAPACTAGTGQLSLAGAPGNEAVVTFTADGLSAGSTYTFVAFWDIPPTSNVRFVLGGAPNPLEVPTLGGVGAGGLVLALMVAALVLVGRRRMLQASASHE
jgi:hypothetical protein